MNRTHPNKRDINCPPVMPTKKLCFVIGPIGEDGSDIRIHADWLLEGIIEPVIAGFSDFQVKRADHDPRPGLIDAQMINDLLNADLVIADLSFSNPNAFYEIGIRHMAQKPIIHMQLKEEKPPFDLSLYRAVKFSRAKFRDLEEAKVELKRSIEAVLETGYEVENPVTHARGRVQLSQHATSEQKVLLDQMEALQERMEMLEDQWRFIAPVGGANPRRPMRFYGGGDPIQMAPTTIITFTKTDGFTDSLKKQILNSVTQELGLATQIAQSETTLMVLVPASVTTEQLYTLMPGVSGLQISIRNQFPS